MIRRSLPILLLLLLLAPGARGAAFDFTDYRLLLESYLEAWQEIDGIAVNTVDYRRWHAEQNRPDAPYRRRSTGNSASRGRGSPPSPTRACASTGQSTPSTCRISSSSTSSTSTHGPGGVSLLSFPTSPIPR